MLESARDEPTMPDQAPPDAPRGDERQQRKLDLAARAAWLYYVAGNTQDQMARKLNVSRQAAQRLVASGGRRRPDQVPSRPSDRRLHRARRGAADALRAGLCRGRAGRCRPATAWSASRAPRRARSRRISPPRRRPCSRFSTGRTLRATVAQVAPMERPQHTVVSLVGTMTRDGRASPYDVVMRLADRTGADLLSAADAGGHRHARAARAAAGPAPLSGGARAGGAGQGRVPGRRHARRARRRCWSTASSPRPSSRS